MPFYSAVFGHISHLAFVVPLQKPKMIGNQFYRVSWSWLFVVIPKRYGYGNFLFLSAYLCTKQRHIRSLTKLFSRNFREVNATKGKKLLNHSVEKSSKTRSPFLCKSRHFSVKSTYLLNKLLFNQLISRKIFECDRVF